MNTTLKNQIEKSLALALSDLKDEKETLSFLKEFLTPKELEILSKRLAVAYWITKKRNNTNIQNNLKVTTKTITENTKLLQKDIITKVIKRLDADEWADKWSEKIKKINSIF